jgi:hypothetical protein
MRTILGPGARARSQVLHCSILIAVGAALFGRASWFDFVHYDDYELLVLNYGSIASRTAIARAFWTDSFAVLAPEAKGVFYRPLLVVVYGVEAQLGGTQPFVYHLAGIGLHLLASCLAYLWLITFGLRHLLALGLALVFLCHPAAVPVVAWIPCQNESLLAIWSIASTLSLVAYLRRGWRPGPALSLACLAAALFTKESAVVLPGVLACVAALERTGRPGEGRALVWSAGGAFIVLAGWAALRHLALGASPIGLSRALSNLSTLIVYLGKTLLPLELATVPHPEDSSLLPGLVALGTLALATAGTGRRLVGVAGLGLSWYAAFLLPTLLVHPQAWGLEHRIYVPLPGMLLFAAQLRLPAGLRAPAMLGPALVLTMALAFAFLSARRLSEFRDPIAYWESAARHSPHSAFVATRLAWRYYESNRGDDAIEAATRALDLHEGNPHMYQLRGLLWARRGAFRQAEEDLRRAIALDPEHVAAWESLAALQHKLGRDGESRSSQQRAKELRERAARRGSGPANRE